MLFNVEGWSGPSSLCESPSPAQTVAGLTTGLGSGRSTPGLTILVSGRMVGPESVLAFLHYLYLQRLGFARPRFRHDARFAILISVEGWSTPSLVFRLYHLHPQRLGFSPPALVRYVDARFAMLISAEGWSAPSLFLRVSVTCTNSVSASAQRPWPRYVDARLAMLIIAVRSAPSLFLRVSTTCTQ